MKPAVPWACLTCRETGTTTGTDAGQDAKHVKATGHTTSTGLHTDALDRVAAAVRDENERWKGWAA